MISSKVEVTILDTLRYSCYWYPFSRHIKNICSMASTIPIKSSVDERASSVHFLPCSINHGKFELEHLLEHGRSF